MMNKDNVEKNKIVMSDVHLNISEKIEVINGIAPNLPSERTDIVVKFDKVNKSFGDKKILVDVNFEVEDLPNTGELISIVGQSGCGKSTILRLIAGLEPQFPQTSGRILVFGKPVVGPGIDRGVIDQKYSLLPHLTVLDNVSFGLMLGGMSKKDRHAMAREWIVKVGLEGSEGKYPSELSGGMQQRVAIAATLIMKPKIILMDEPFGALDPKIRLQMQELLIGLWKEEQSTVFIVTHSMEEAVYLGDRVFRMGTKPGRIVEELKLGRTDASPEEVRKMPWFNEAVRELLRRLENDSPASGDIPSQYNEKGIK